MGYNGLGTITMQDIERAFEELDHRTEGTVLDPGLKNQSSGVEPSTVYPFDELQHINDGIVPRADNETNVHERQETEESRFKFLGYLYLKASQMCSSNKFIMFILH